MKIWYSCKVKFTRETEDGFLKQVTENYLLDAVSYTEAETRIYEQMEQNVRGEFSVNSISKTNISEVINYEDEESWFKSKVTYSTVDADKAKEVKVTSYYLVSAENAKQAFERIEDSLSSMLVPFDIPAITLTNVVEVFPFISEEDREPDFRDNRATFEKELPATRQFDEVEEEESEEEEIEEEEVEEEEIEEEEDEPEEDIEESDEDGEVDDESSEDEGSESEEDDVEEEDKN